MFRSYLVISYIEKIWIELVRPFKWLPVYFCTCQPLYLSTPLPVYLSTYLFTGILVYQSTCLLFYFSTCLSPYLPVYLYFLLRFTKGLFLAVPKSTGHHKIPMHAKISSTTPSIIQYSSKIVYSHYLFTVNKNLAMEGFSAILLPFLVNPLWK